MKERVHWIDIAKGICMLAVIAGHSGREEFNFVYSFHLTVFFILAGYTLKKEPITGQYVSGKFRRLMVPFFLTCLAVTVMDVLNSFILYSNGQIATATNLISRGINRVFFASGGQEYFGPIYFGDAIGAIWFLPALFFALLITQFIRNRLHSRVQQMLAAVILAVIAAGSAQIIWLPFAVQAGAFAVPFILFGVFLNELRLIDEIFKWWHYVIFAAVFLVGHFWGYAEGFYMVSCYMSDWLITPLCAICSSLAVIGISKGIKKFAPLEFVGRHSLIFLCVHLLEMNTLYWVYSRVIEHFSLPKRFLVAFPLKLCLIFALSSLLVLLKKISIRGDGRLLEGRRDRSIDIMRFILIVLMIVGHVQIDQGLRNFIYSFHMLAFIMISGYFYRADLPLKTNLLKTVKLLIPYGAFAVAYILVNHRGWLTELKIVTAGVSYTNRFLRDIPTVGPVYFILLLFGTRLIYVFIDKIRNEWLKNAVILGLFLLSLYLGTNGFWLAWSFDAALFCLLFYHIAFYMRKYQILEKCTKHTWIYFPLAFLWMFMIYKGPMELSVRRYGNAGLTLVGVVSAFVILYLLCRYLSRKLPGFAVKVISLAGQSTAWILVLHTLFFGRINGLVADTFGLDPQNYFHLGVSVVFHLAAGTVLFLLIEGGKKVVRRLWGAARSGSSAA